MRAEISKVHSVTILSLSGQISYDTLNHFRTHCFTKLKGERVVFNLQGLNFVGSVGMTSFFEIIRDLYEQKILNMNFCCVKIEFRRLLEAWFFDNIEIYDQQEMAIESLNNPKIEDTSRIRRPIRVPNLIQDEPLLTEVSQDWNGSADLTD